MMVLRTVRGDISSTDIEYMQSHDHVFVDGRGNIPAAVLRSGDPNVLLPVGQANYYWVRRHYFNIDNFLLDSEQSGLREMLQYKSAGGDALVDSTCIGMGRNVEALARISKTSGVHIITGTGFYLEAMQDESTIALDADAMAEVIRREIQEGIENTSIRAGFIGEVGLSWPPTDFELRSLRVAAEVHDELGVAVQVHPGRDQQAPLEIVKAFEAAGGDVTRLIICHLDRTVSDYSILKDLAETGCFLEFDLFGRESAHYPMSDHVMPNDGQRLRTIAGLIRDGHEAQILIAQDVSKKVHLKEYGGEGYGHIIENVIPLMPLCGISDKSIQAITVENPVKAFSLK